MYRVKATVEIGEGWELKLKKTDMQSHAPLSAQDRHRLKAELREALRSFKGFLDHIDFADINLE